MNVILQRIRGYKIQLSIMLLLQLYFIFNLEWPMSFINAMKTTLTIQFFNFMHKLMFKYNSQKVNFNHGQNNCNMVYKNK